MTDTVRWNGHKGHKLIVSAQKTAPSETEASFFKVLREFDAELDGKQRTDTEERFLASMRAFLDELEDSLKDEDR